MPYIQIDQQVLHFWLRRSQRAKRLQILFKQGSFEIVAPKRITNRDILRFSWEQIPWMLKVLTKQPDAIDLSWPAEFLTGEKFPYRARRITLQVEYGNAFETVLQEDNLKVQVPYHTTLCASLSETVQLSAESWLKAQAENIIRATINYFCPILGRWPRSVHLKQQKSRWGSCSALDKIYLNWLLVLAPEGVLEYVVVHELCHLVHRNHSKRFWAKVAQCLPNYQEQEKWLKRYGQTLKPMLTNERKI